MSKCKHLVDISPYDPLCDHPCMLYGGGAVEAECETCQYRIEDLERENEKLRELCVDYDKTLDIAIKGYVGIDKPLLIGAIQTALRSRMYKLGIEVE